MYCIIKVKNVNVRMIYTEANVMHDFEKYVLLIIDKKCVHLFHNA